MKCQTCKLHDEENYCIVVDHNVHPNCDCAATRLQLHGFVKESKAELASLGKAISEAEYILTVGVQSTEKCPKCGSTVLVNKIGDKWCSMVGCDWGCER